MTNMKRWNRESLKFVTDTERSVLKKVGSIKYGEKLSISKADEMTLKDFEILVRKAACYYHIDIHCRWSKEKDQIIINVGGL